MRKILAAFLIMICSAALAQVPGPNSASGGGGGGGAVYGPTTAGNPPAAGPTGAPILVGVLDGSSNIRALSPSNPAPITGTVNQGTPAAIANAWPFYLSQGGAALSATNGLPTTDTNAANTIGSAGAATTKAQSVQGIAGGVAVGITSIDGGLVTLGSKSDTAESGATAGTDTLMQVAKGSYNTIVRTQAPAGNGGAAVANAVQGVSNGAPVATVEAGSSLASAGITPNGGTGATCSGSTATTGCIAKNAQGNLYRLYATATTAPAAQQYCVAINAATVPTSGTAITAIDFAPFNLATTAGSTCSINLGPGPPSAYSTGIVFLISTSLTTYTPGTAAFPNTSVR